MSLPNLLERLEAGTVTAEAVSEGGSLGAAEDVSRVERSDIPQEWRGASDGGQR